MTFENSQRNFAVTYFCAPTAIINAEEGMIIRKINNMKFTVKLVNKPVLAHSQKLSLVAFSPHILPRFTLISFSEVRQNEWNCLKKLK